MNPPKDEPIRIEYKRWRNKRKGSIVVVIGVEHELGQHGWYARVKVRTKEGKEVSWPGGTFLRMFEPMGRKLRFKSTWERIR